ncbi:putative aspartic-type endopeptidase [Pyrenophora seminiperda CCB06]|uniref:Putative aspartic-type endopeptidase n=1 Tax=Pyrenophora seminiperda CCB06 TaxID=1302712 RepID=A0A3M7MB27_9PLEO|nr:putative aspartic-type endopeptidase [Pyrenophora seminiperda CCB06]
MALRNSLHTAVAALALLPSYAIGTPFLSLGNNNDANSRRNADVNNAQLEAREMLNELGIPVDGFQIDLKSTRLVKRASDTGTAPVKSIELGTMYASDIQVHGETFRLLLDTGSPDLWLPSQGVKCVDGNAKEVPQSQCNFTRFTPPTYSGGQIPDRHFNRSYTNGNHYLGTVGYEDVTIGDLTVERQIVAKVNVAKQDAPFHGDWNGVLGLGFSNLTTAFPGLDPTKDNDTIGNPHNAIPYNPWILSAYESGVIKKPVFTLVLEPMGKPDGESAGTLIVGGAASPSSTRYTGAPGSAKLRRYPAPYRNYWWDFVPDGMNIGGRFIPWTEKSTVDNGLKTYYVDSGQRWTTIPESTMTAWLKTFSPPATQHSSGFGIALCNATFDSLAIRVGGSDIAFGNSSLLLQPPIGAVDDKPGYCWTGVMSGVEPLLGSTFLSNVAVTFDMTPGAERMVFSNIIK